MMLNTVAARGARKISSRVVIVALCGLMPWFATPAQAQGTAQDYPNRSIRFIVPHTPGSLVDTFSRSLAQHLSERLGRPVVIDNRPGASQAIGAELAARSAPDGYTIFLGTQVGLVLNGITRKNLPYDTLRDFAPISLLFMTRMYLLVHSSVPAKSVQEVVALARSRPGKLSYASIGVGSSSHLAMELFKSTMKINILHVPYKGQAQATADVLAGHVDMMFSVSALSSGKLRVLAYAGQNRSVAMPSVPTMNEAGVTGFDVSSWFSVVAPAGVPRPIIERLNHDIVDILRSPPIRKQAAADGTIELSPSTPEELTEHIRSQIPFWAKIVRDAGIQPE